MYLHQGREFAHYKIRRLDQQGTELWPPYRSHYPDELDKLVTKTLKGSKITGRIRQFLVHLGLVGFIRFASRHLGYVKRLIY